MSEENNQTEEIREELSEENAPEESAPETRRAGFFTRRNGVIALGAVALLAIALALLTTVSYRYGVFDNYIKAQFVSKMDDIGINFTADVFRVRISPLRLELKNATFNNKVTGDKLFFVQNAELRLSVKDLYAWQLSRDISIDTTDVEGFEAWVKFDENGKSNFSNLNLVEDQAGSRVNFTYSSLKFSLKNGLVRFGDAQRKISGSAKNILLFLEPDNALVPDDQKRYRIDFTSTDSNFVYDESVVERVDIRAKGIADNKGAEISELKLTSPIGESTLNGRISDWEQINYDLNVASSVDLTQTSSVFPLGTALRGVGNFNGKAIGRLIGECKNENQPDDCEGDFYRVEGEIESDALAASNIRLKAVKINATVEGEDSMYEANGKAIAEMLTFEDFRIDFLQLVGNVRGTGTDFRWVGELQAAAAKTPLGTIAGLYIADAVADYKEKQFGGNFGNLRARSFQSQDINIQNLQAGGVKLNSDGNVTTASAANARIGNFKSKSLEFRDVAAGNVKVKDVPARTDLEAGNLKSPSARLGDVQFRNMDASGARIGKEKDTVTFAAKNFNAEPVTAPGLTIGALSATNFEAKDVPSETVLYANSVKMAKLETDAAILGTINVAGVRMTIRQGRIEATSDSEINAGDVTLRKTADLPQGGSIAQVKINRPVFVLEPSGSYRASADMSLGGGVLGSIKLGAARASVVAENNQVALNNLRADVMEGQINGSAVVALSDRNRSRVDADFTGLDLSKLLGLTGGRVVPIEGKTTGRANLTFAGRNFKTASGTLTADFAANAGTAESGLVPLNGRLALTAANGLFNVDNANLITEKTQLNATGRFDLSGSNSNLNVALNSTDATEIERIIRVLNLSPELEQQLDKYQAQFAGNLNFNGNLTGNFDNPTVEGRAAADTLILRGRDLGSVATNIFVSPTGIELRDGVLQERGGGSLAFNVNAPSIGKNNISIQAKLNNINTGNLLAALPIDFLPSQIKDFQAQTSGEINLTGLPNEMQGEANISSGKGTVNGQPFDGFETRALFRGNLVTLERFEARFGEGYLRANGTYQTDTTAFDFDVQGKDIALARVRPFLPGGTDLSGINGVVDLQAKATGRTEDFKSYNINFNGIGRNIVINENAVGEVTFAGKTENQQLDANLTANFQGQRQVLTANVNFADENLPFRAETTFDQTQLAPFIALVRTPDGVDITGQATGRVFLQGNLSVLGADGKRGFSTDNLAGAAEFSQLALQIGETPLVAERPVSVRFNTREVIIDNAEFSGAGSSVVVNGTKALTDDGINNLTVNGRVNLSIFNALSKNTFFSGLANVSVGLSGVNKTAQLNGTARLENASLATFVGTERLSFDRINGSVRFTSNQAEISALNGFLGGGKITVNGGAVVKGLELQAFRFDVRGNNITAPLPPDFITTGDAEIEISGVRRDGDLNTLIAGTITTRRSVYNQDIDLADFISRRRAASITEGSSSSTSFIGVPKLDIRIEGRDALVVRNNLADLTASASLRVTGDVEYPQISGRITANSGTIIFRKDRYEVQRGVLEFPPNTSIEPYINLQAETEIKGYRIIVNLVGELTNTDALNATVRSSPALPQADVISLITTGNLANTDSGIPTLAQSGINTAAEILTDELINNPLSRATDKLFGLNRFEIDPIISGQRLNPSARLTVGRQINKNLLITYSTNLSQDQNQVLALEYRVSNRLSFVAQYAQRSLSNVTQQNNNFSFEIRLRKRF